MRLLALQGRGPDTEVAHVAPGEVVIPRALQTPELMQLVSEAAAARGVDPREFIVASGETSINPSTGMEEHFLGRFGDWFRSSGKKSRPNTESGKELPLSEPNEANLPSLGRDMPPRELARSYEAYGKIDPANDQARANFARSFLERTGLSDQELNSMRQGVIHGAEKLAPTAAQSGYPELRDIEPSSQLNNMFFVGNDGEVYRKTDEVRDRTPLGATVGFYDRQLGTIENRIEKFKDQRIRGNSLKIARPDLYNRFVP